MGEGHNGKRGVDGNHSENHVLSTPTKGGGDSSTSSVCVEKKITGKDGDLQVESRRKHVRSFPTGVPGCDHTTSQVTLVVFNLYNVGSRSDNETIVLNLPIRIHRGPTLT